MTPKLAAVPSEPATVRMEEYLIDLGTGRRAALAIPADASDAEMLGLVAGAMNACSQIRAQRPRLAIARTMPQ